MNVIFTVYFKKKINELVFKKTLAKIFNIQDFDISNIVSNDGHKLSYEISCFKEIEESIHLHEFCYEVNCFLEKEIILKSRIYNILIFAQKLSRFLGLETLIDEQSDNPYQWILIDSKRIYLIKSIDENTNCILVNIESKIELSFSKSIQLLQNKNHYENNNSNNAVYYVKDSMSWLKCIR